MQLTSLLLDFTVSVLVNKPGDMLEFAVAYFNRLLDERRSRLVIENENNHFDEEGDSVSSDFSK